MNKRAYKEGHLSLLLVASTIPPIHIEFPNAQALSKCKVVIHTRRSRDELSLNKRASMTSQQLLENPLGCVVRALSYDKTQGNDKEDSKGDS